MDWPASRWISSLSYSITSSFAFFARLAVGFFLGSYKIKNKISIQKSAIREIALNNILRTSGKSLRSASLCFSFMWSLSAKRRAYFAPQIVQICFKLSLVFLWLSMCDRTEYNDPNGRLHSVHVNGFVWLFLWPDSWTAVLKFFGQYGHWYLRSSECVIRWWLYTDCALNLYWAERKSESSGVP